MRVAVIGAGIVGVTTAYELAADGHEVVVFERRGSVAAESSFAHPGLLAPPPVLPWSGAAAAAQLLPQWLRRRGTVQWGGRHPDPLLLLRLFRAWRGARRPEQAGALLRLARFSREHQHALTQRLRLDYEQADGLLLLLRSEQDLSQARPALKGLAELGIAFHLVDTARCRQLEPGLNDEVPLHAGVHLAQGGAGNCRQFAHLLRHEAERLGVEFRFHHQVRALQGGTPVRLDYMAREGDDASVFVGSMKHLPQVNAGQERFDAAVVCAAAGAASLLRTMELPLHTLPAYGYSVTAPLRRLEAHADLGPRAALIDQQHQVLISRLGQRVRVAGGMEIGGPAPRLSPGLLSRLYRILNEWFPGAVQWKQAQPWKSAYPLLADGVPKLGTSGRPGIWLNLGHGSAGWALACGCARVVADGLVGATPPVDLTGL